MQHPLYNLVSIGNPLYDQISNSELDFNSDTFSGGSITVCLVADALGISRLVMIGSVPKKERFKILSAIEQTQIEHFLMEPEIDIPAKETVQEDACQGQILGPLGRIRIRDIPEEFLLSEVIVLNPVLQEIDIDLVEWVSSSSDALILIDMQGFLRRRNKRGYGVYTPHSEDIRQLLNSVDLAKANQVEAQLMTGEEDAFVAVETMVEWGAEIGIITRGNRGCIIFDGNEFLQIPAFETDVACSLSAGDIFLGAFATHLLETDNLLDCGLFATSTTSIILEKEPQLPLFIDRSEIQKRIGLLQDDVKIL
ncbi:MAG: hypothetical protein GF411_11200 [Candidatus Lokiarchaeota archaeon]|nr:hypothetical protein [Candidatus Lokiarchaeota archaeon]